MDTILIVDDEAPFIRSLTTGLSSNNNNYKILSASNGQEAVDQLNTNKVDLVLTDLKMPKMGGYELISYLNKHHPTIPIILMTAYGTPELEQNFKMLGVHHYIEKPVDLDDVATTISNALNNRAHMNHSLMKDHLGQKFLTVLNEPINGKMSGEVIARRGRDSGRIFITHGKVAWANVSTVKHSFIGLLAKETTISNEDIRAVFDEAKIEAKNFGETLISWGLIDHAKLRSLVLRHVATALLEILTWDDTMVMFVPDNRTYSSDIVFSFDEILYTLNDLGADQILDWSIKPDELAKEFSTREDQLQQKLLPLTKINGFRLAGVFSTFGSLLAGVPKTDPSLKQVGTLITKSLLKTQGFTEKMKIERGHSVHISTPEVEILVRCLNENINLKVNEVGKAHVYTMLILNKNVNIGMAKIQLNKATTEIAPMCR